MQNAVKTWASSQFEEDKMNDDHAPLWRQMISLSVSDPSREEQVLDFGCNQGGFLEMLYYYLPYQKATGVDIAAESLDIARKRLAKLPVTIGLPDILETQENVYDRAYSHEVMYLLPDLDQHAALIRKVLKSGGCYYAAIGCHTDQPLWKDWHPLISGYSSVPVQNYSLDDYANAFLNAGFKVGVQPYRLNGFFQHKQNSAYFPKVTDTIRYYNEDKVLFRFQKQD